MENLDNEYEDETPMDLGDLLSEIVLSLVDDRSAVRVEEQGSREVAVYLIHVKPEDRGRVIGRNGVTIEAIRTLMERIGSLQGMQRVVVEVADSRQLRNGTKPVAPHRGPRAGKDVGPL